MAKILFMTIGTGVGTNEDKSRNLAHGLETTIYEVQPDFVVFFGSENSEKTINYIKEFYLEKNPELFDYEFVPIYEIDSFTHCYKVISNQILRFKNDDIKIDYTSGTKTMTMTAAICSMLYGKDLLVVSGTRGSNGIVIPGTEEVKRQNLYLAYDKVKIDQIQDLFDNYRYESAEQILNTIINYENKEGLKILIQAYGAWDKFDHQTALDYFDKIRFNDFPEIQDQLVKNICVLRNINNEKSRDKCYYILASLLNNAHRRFEECRFDDGIARLYRSLELIGQIKLKDYGLVSSNLDINLLKYEYPHVNIEYYETKKTMDGKIKLGLVEDYKLLQSLDDEIGTYFMSNFKAYQNFLLNRNKSILAHGLENKSEKDYLEFETFVIDLSKKVKKGMNRFLTVTTFPKFKRI